MPSRLRAAAYEGEAATDNLPNSHEVILADIDIADVLEMNAESIAAVDHIEVRSKTPAPRIFCRR